MPLRRRPAVAIALFAIVALVPRLWALRAAGWDSLTPDGARFLNLARSIDRGLGYVTPEAWPAWLDPVLLPMPERSKEPAYPYAIAALGRLLHDPFRAGQWISLVAGLLLPFATWWLVRALEPDRDVADVAALLVAASPLLIQQSVYVMADSLFALLVTLGLALAATRGRDGARERVLAAGAGLALGLACLVRAQGLLALPAAAGLLAIARRPRAALSQLGVFVAATGLTLAPWMAHNLQLGRPLHSDFMTTLVIPYMDPFTFNHGLDPPPAPFGFLLAHLGEVVRHTLGSVKNFGWHTLPQELLGSRIWLVPLAFGTGAAFARVRVWWPLLLFAALTCGIFFVLEWLPRYFSALTPVACALTALGGVRLVRGAGPRAVVGPVRIAHVAGAGLAALLLLASANAARHAGETYHPEWAAARAWGPRLGARLAPGEAVMVDVTSYWALAADRPAVHAVLADERRLAATLARLRVRYAAMTPAFAHEYASRLPAGRLPDWIRPVEADSANGIGIYEVRPR
jgi:4-amino-4-deoxy-L-arabinose transferase-like glycosyltransferase